MLKTYAVTVRERSTNRCVQIHEIVTDCALRARLTIWDENRGRYSVMTHTMEIRELS